MARNLYKDYCIGLFQKVGHSSFLPIYIFVSFATAKHILKFAFGL